MLRVIIFILVLCSHSIWAVESCESTKDLSHPNLTWKEIGTSKMYSAFVDVVGKLCAGVNLDNQKIERVIYRDDMGLEKNHSVLELLRKDLVIISKSDVPSYAQGLVRSTPILTIKLNKETSGVDKNSYEFSFKFLRNVAKGFSAADVRDLVFSTTVDKRFLDLKTKYQNAEFDELQLTVSPSLKINSIRFLERGQYVKEVQSLNLPEALRII